MSRFSLVIAATAGLLTACSSTTPSSSEPAIPNADIVFLEKIQQFKADPSSISYAVLWSDYLASSQKDDTGGKQQAFFALQEDLDSGAITCTDVDWFDVTLQNFWSLEPHITAQTCYESIGDEQNATFHGNAIEFLVTGILSSGDGEHEYSAFEVATWGDAADIIELAGYEVIDTFLELKHRGQGLYYIYVVNDPETGFQKEIFFENNRFLHAVIDVQFPFAGIANSLETSVVDYFAQSDSYAQIAKGKLAADRGDIDEAIEWYQKAAKAESAVASFRLGISCLNPQQTVLAKEECTSYLFDAAESGLVVANLALAMLYEEGISVEQDSELAIQIMQASEPLLEPGEAWLKLALLYGGQAVVKNEEKRRQYLSTAAEQGNVMAEYWLFVEQLEAEKDTIDQTNIEHFRPLEYFAEQGVAPAQVAYARVILEIFPAGDVQRNSAAYWLKEAAAQHFPQASLLLGRAHQYGWFGQTNMLLAYINYNEAAIRYNSEAQLAVGYFNDIGRVVEMDKTLALSWYFLCGKANNLGCMHNLALFFRDGVVVDQDYELALSYFTHAAEQGHINSMTSLGMMYWYGRGVAVDFVTANQWFNKACNENDGYGCNLLATSYQDGEGVGFDQSKANELFLQSCDNGYSGGCRNLGISYAEGRGVEANAVKADEFYGRACKLGDAKACSF